MQNKTIVVEFLHPLATPDHVGIIPLMLNVDNPKSAREQLHDGYLHGGGWWPMIGFTLHPDNTLQYPGDEPFRPLARIMLRQETIVIYEHAFVAIIQPDQSFEVARMD